MSAAHAQYRGQIVYIGTQVCVRSIYEMAACGVMAVLQGLPLLLVVLFASCKVHASSSADGPAMSGSGAAPRIPLNFILMLSNSTSFNTWGSIPAVDIALQMVDESGLLGKYELRHSKPLDSHVS